MNSEEFKLKKIDGFCKSPERQLLDYVTNNEPVHKIKSFIKDNPEALTTVIGPPFNKPILYIACNELASTVNPKIVETLVESGADLYYVDELHDYKQGLHFAALGGNPQILKIIIESLKVGEINSISNGNTALNLLIKEGDSNNPNFLDCTKLLIQADVDINLPDNENFTPVFWAARKGYIDVETILNESKQKVDIECHALRVELAEDYVEDDWKGVPQKNSNGNKSNSFPDALFNFLKERNEDEFIKSKCLVDFVDIDDGVVTLLQIATTNRLAKAVKTLLDIGANPNKTTATTRTTAIEIAAMKEYSEIFVLLLKDRKTIIPSHILMRIIVRDGLHHSMYYSLLMEHKDELNLNVPDIYGNTALHYAILFGGPEKTLDLLRAGASMASKNKCGKSPVELIDANILETHLDECLDANLEADIYNEMFIAQYNYTTLILPKTHESDTMINENMHEAEAANKLIAKDIPRLTSEIDVISSISNSDELRPLLRHPVLTSFVYMKWHRIRWVYFINLIFYVVFCLSLILYLLVVYTNQHSSEHRIVGSILLVLLCVTFLLLVLRELFQIVVTRSAYLYNLENWLELMLIILTAMIILKTSAPEPLRKQISAFAILLVAFELVIFLGQHPGMSTNVAMFRTVSFNFFKFLLWYSILIIAFAFSFYTLFRNTDNEMYFFMNPVLSLFKTIIMLTGEFDASDIRFQSYPVTSHIIFMLFVFMVAIVLFNLLNGLAVSDTQLIKSDSELIGHIARIRHIAFAENVIICGFIPNSVITVIHKCCSCLTSKTQKSVAEILVKRIFLFSGTFKCYRTGVFPNRAMIVLVDGETEMAYANIPLDRQTAKRTKQLIRRKKEILEQKKKEQSVIEMQRSIMEMQQSATEMLELLRKEQLVILNKLYCVIANSNETQTLN